MSSSAAEKPKGGDLARLAGIWCNQPGFQRWIGAQDAAMAKTKLCFLCGVESRAHLDHDKTAAAIFHSSIRDPYMAHTRTQRR